MPCRTESIHKDSCSQAEVTVGEVFLFSVVGGDSLQLEDGQAVQLEDGTTAYIHTPKGTFFVVVLLLL